MRELLESIQRRVLDIKQEAENLQEARIVIDYEMDIIPLYEDIQKLISLLTKD